MLHGFEVRHDLVEKQRKSRFAVAHDALCTAEGRNGRGTFIAMQVDDEIKVLAPDAQDESGKGQKMVILALFVDEQAFVDMFVVLHEVRELFVCQQRDVCLRIVRAQGTQHRRHEHEIPNMHEIDDKNIFIHVDSFLYL